MRMRHDESALESLPLKLMIVSLVASLSIVPASEALESFKTRDFLMNAELQLERIRSACQMVALEGPGSARQVTLDFGSGARLAFESLTIGDVQHGPNASALVLEFTNGARMVRQVDNPPIWLRGPNNASLVITVPGFCLDVSVVRVNSTYCVCAEV